MILEPVDVPEADFTALDKIAKALSIAQAQLGHAKKDATNPHFRSKYATLASVWDACRDALVNNGLAVTQCVDFEESVTFLETVLMHESGQHITSRVPILFGDRKQDMQSLGSAISYARRYSLASIVGISVDDDDGETAAGRAPQQRFNFSQGEPNATQSNPANQTQNKPVQNAQAAPRTDRIFSNDEKAIPAQKAAEIPEVLKGFATGAEAISTKWNSKTPEHRALVNDARIQLNKESPTIKISTTWLADNKELIEAALKDKDATLKVIKEELRKLFEAKPN